MIDDPAFSRFLISGEIILLSTIRPKRIHHTGPEPLVLPWFPQVLLLPILRC